MTRRCCIDFSHWSTFTMKSALLQEKGNDRSLSDPSSIRFDATKQQTKLPLVLFVYRVSFLSLFLLSLITIAIGSNLQHRLHWSIHLSSSLTRRMKSREKLGLWILITENIFSQHRCHYTSIQSALIDSAGRWEWSSFSFGVFYWKCKQISS
jgi:hypothetical protein